MLNKKLNKAYNIYAIASLATVFGMCFAATIWNYGGSTSIDNASLKNAQTELGKTTARYDALKDSLDQETDKKIEADIKFQDAYPRVLHKDSTISDYFEFRADPDVRTVDSICNMYYNQVYDKHSGELRALEKKQTKLQKQINKITADKARADSIAQMSTMDRIKGNLRLLKNDLIR